MYEAEPTGMLRKLLPEGMYDVIAEMAKKSKSLHCEFEMKLYDGDDQEKSNFIIDLILSKGDFEIRLYDKHTKEFILQLPTWHFNCVIDEIPPYDNIA